MSKKIKISLLIIWVLAALIFACTRSRAEGDIPDLFPIPTFNFDPEQGYSDYLELMSSIPVLTPAPDPNFAIVVDPVPEDSTPPTSDPFDPSITSAPQGNVSFDYTNVSINQYIARMVDGNRVYYRGSGTYSDGVPPVPTSSSNYLRRGDLGWYSTINIFTANSRLYSSDDYLYQSLHFSGVSGIPLNSKLVFSPVWSALYPTYLLPTTDFLYAFNLDVFFHVTLTYSSGNLEYFDQTISVETLQHGLSFPINVTDDISAIDIELYLYNSSPVDDVSGVQTPIYFTRGSRDDYYSINAFITLPQLSPETEAINNQTNTIGGFFSSLFQGFLNLFVPNSEMIQDFINDKIQDTQDNPLSFATVALTRVLSLFVDPSDSPPELSFNGYSINVSGMAFQLIPPFTVDFSVIPSNLLTYSRMVGDIAICWAFTRYLARKLKAIFNIKFADTFEEISEADGLDPQLFD